MKPHTDLVKILVEHKCKVSYKQSGKDHFLIHVNYNEAIKSKPGQGLEVWGNNEKVFENINATIKRFHPNSELNSQNGIGSAVWRVGGQSFNK